MFLLRIIERPSVQAALAEDDTEGEDIISEAVTENVENNKKHEILSNGHSNSEENKAVKSVSYKFV